MGELGEHLSCASRDFTLRCYNPRPSKQQEEGGSPEMMDLQGPASSQENTGYIKLYAHAKRQGEFLFVCFLRQSKEDMVSDGVPAS